MVYIERGRQRNIHKAIGTRNQTNSIRIKIPQTKRNNIHRLKIRVFFYEKLIERIKNPFAVQVETTKETF